MQDLLLWFLGSSILILILIKVRVEQGQLRRTGLLASNLGGSMTIGTRQVQEDCYYMQENKQGCFLAVADGMGESYGGRIAARTAIAVCEELFSRFHIVDNPQYFFRKLYQNANQEILKALDQGGKGGASLATVLICNEKLYYSVVGNVKIFVFRKGDLVEVSTGHTLNRILGTEFAQGNLTRSEARMLLENHRLYNFLGQDGFAELELFDIPVTLKEDDMVVLMTDGVYELLSFMEMEQVFRKSISSEQKCYEVIELVNRHEKEEKDNGSIVIWQNTRTTI